MLFAHVYKVQQDGTGLGDYVTSDRRAAVLRETVTEAYRTRLPTGLTHELRPDDLELRLGDSEEDLARDLCEAFRHLHAASVRDALSDPIAADFLNGFFGVFLSDSFADERNMGQYLTPAEVVDTMVTIGFSLLADAVPLWLDGDPEAGRIADPSCGVGSFLSTAARRLLALKTTSHPGAASEAWFAELVTHRLVGIDKSDRMIRLALTNFALLGGHQPSLHLANALGREGSDGALTSALEGTAALILTNPPFGAEFRGGDIAEYSLASEWSTSTPAKIDSELLFVERYLDWLADDGVFVAVVPDSILTNRGLYGDLRRALSRRATIEAVVSLPPRTFGAAGTATKTSVLALRKSRRPGRRAYVALCKEVGFDVETRANLRQKVRHDRNDLLAVMSEIGRAPVSFGRLVADLADSARWDAWFHASLAPGTESQLSAPKMDAVWVRDVATLATDRIDPRRAGDEMFRYIEISDVDGERLTASAKHVLTSEAPSRARKQVRVGDVLVATVRPERRAIGVVAPDDDGVICSTGFAVLRPNGIEPLVLAELLRTDFVNEQLTRHNMGVSYPAIADDCLLDVLLPIRASGAAAADEVARRMMAARASYEQARSELTHAVAELSAEATGA